ncbi:DUF1194 domain-containing protein [Roseomonas aerophila]|uniref:DUF1194 domain-containing protein n=1 Tax=Teichococcus aerophilus TaxID=1224513 RepID=A0ABR7RST8_9PROT|nr:DUF1194 domain-containing protein [Pseudoroseomonas aerophila]MBC9209642.1 DUF1194 domain-containing protein [Pseudoroseomonas aerophila]
MRRRSLLAAAGLAAFPAVARAEEPVDTLLVLAVDVSRSVDEDEARLQREGYRNGVTDPKVVEAMLGGVLGSVGLAYVEWAGSEYQRLVLPWRRIASRRDAQAWAEALAEAPRQSLSWTSISGALEFSGTVLEQAPFEGTRQVIDVSGDGVNNSGPPPEAVRDRLVAHGVVINGLPIVNDRPSFGRMPAMPLDQYYRESVIGGEGAFMVVADDFESFGVAVRRKLIREIA